MHSFVHHLLSDCSALGNVAFFGMLIKEIEIIFSFTNPFLEQLIFFSFLLAFFTMLPIPGLPGLQVFFGSRLWYVVTIGCVFGYLLLFVLEKFSLFGALFIGGLAWLLYYVSFEKAAW